MVPRPQAPQPEGMNSSTITAEGLHEPLRTIVTCHVYPPIPIRTHDWSAHYDGEEEGDYGWGATEEEAIKDLKENYEAP